MDGFRPVVLAVVLCAASFAVVPVSGVDTGSDDRLRPVVSQNNTTEFLALPPEERETTTFGRASIDVAGSVEGDVGEIRAEYVQARFERAMSAAETDDERRAALQNATDRVDRRIDALEDRHSEAIAALNAGEITPREYLRRVAVIDSEARTLAATIDDIDSRTDSTSRGVSAERIGELETRTLPLQGPVRAHLHDVLTGDVAPTRVFVETTDGGVVVAAMLERDGDPVYVRESHDPGSYDPDLRDQFGGDDRDALDRMSELYPWTLSNSGGIEIGGTPSRNAGVYQIDISHSHGRLMVSLDGGTTEVFREIQFKDPNAVPTTDLTADGDGIRVLVNATRAGGPIAVAVVDENTGELRAASVEINGDPVGTTANTDRLWAVAPRGSVEINATHAGETVTVETTLQ